MSCSMVAETTTLIVTSRVAGPLWFDILAAALLIGAALLGAELFMSYRQRTKPGIAMHRET